MELNANRVLEILLSKGISTLYHANTVKTSSVFLKHGRLLSRGNLEERGFSQTHQNSDAKDKKYGLWYDLFFDDVDIHARTKKDNVYGPVLFTFDVNVLAEAWFASVWITKENPILWNDSLTHRKKYFFDESEVQSHYQKGTFKQMLVFRHIGGVLRLQPYLKEIIVDDPRRLIDEYDTYEQVIEILEEAAAIGNISNIPIKKRECCPDCKCHQSYQALNRSGLEKLFGQ